MKTTPLIPYRSPSREKYVDISLSDFDTEELRKEYSHRLGGTGSIDSHAVFSIDRTALLRLRELLLCKRETEALDEMRDLIRDALGTAL